jgi:hypothetical protein
VKSSDIRKEGEPMRIYFESGMENRVDFYVLGDIFPLA